MPFIWQNGAQFIDDNGQPNLDDPAVKEAFQYLQSLRSAGVSALPSEIGASWNMDGFGRKRVAMAFSGLWAVNFLEETFAATPYKTAPMPAGEEQRSIAYVVGYVIPKNVEDPEKAWRLLRFLTSKEGQAASATLDIGLPPRRSVVKIQNLRADPVKSVFIDSAEFAQTWQLGDNQKVLDETQTALQSMYITDTPIDEALAKLKKRLDIETEPKSEGVDDDARR